MAECSLPYLKVRKKVKKEDGSILIKKVKGESICPSTFYLFEFYPDWP